MGRIPGIRLAVQHHGTVVSCCQNKEEEQMKKKGEHGNIPDNDGANDNDGVSVGKLPALLPPTI
jgi:hypothetical protein